MKTLKLLKDRNIFTYYFWKASLIGCIGIFALIRCLAPETSFLELISSSVMGGAIIGAYCMPCTTFVQSILPFDTVLGFVISLILSWLLLLAIMSFILSVLGNTIGFIVIAIIGVATIGYHIWQTVLVVKELRGDQSLPAED